MFVVDRGGSSGLCAFLLTNMSAAGGENQFYTNAPLSSKAAPLTVYDLGDFNITQILDLLSYYIGRAIRRC